MLPISNPANLVIYGGHTPPLLQWLPRFAIPSALSILATFVILRLTQSRALKAEEVARDVKLPDAVRRGKARRRRHRPHRCRAAGVLRASAFSSACRLRSAASLTAIAVMILKRASPWPTIKGVCWGVLPLVAGLFVLVEALDKTGLIRIDRRFPARRCPTLRVANGLGRRRV